MALYFFCFALLLIPVTVIAGAVQASLRFARRLVTLRRARFSVSANEARPGDTIQAHANVAARSSRPVTVVAHLTCTMFDHRPHELYASSRPMLASDAAPHQYTAELQVPAYALQTGRVGSKKSLANHAHRMLVVWTVDFEVRTARGTVLYRRSHPFDVPRGRRLQTHLRRMSLLAIDTFSSIRNDMLFNWLVHLATCDGAVTPAERTLLYELVSEMDGMADLEEASRRVERELHTHLMIDGDFLHRYVPLNERLEFYRALVTLATADGKLNERERKMLADSLKMLGITSDDVKHIEGEVARAREPQAASL